MAEWSKAVDLSPTISGCAGSNPASRKKYFTVIITFGLLLIIHIQFFFNYFLYFLFKFKIKYKLKT